MSKVMEKRGLRQVIPFSLLNKLVFVKVSKEGRGWVASVHALDRALLAETIDKLEKTIGGRQKISKEKWREVHTNWVVRSLDNQPIWSLAGTGSYVDLKVMAIVMMMYGAKPAMSGALDLIRKVKPTLLDPVTGITGTNTLYYVVERKGLRIPFRLPSAGYVPYTFPNIVAKLCENNKFGECGLCGKRMKYHYVKGNEYSCGFIHDFCALERVREEPGALRSRTWNFVCKCGATHVFTSPTRFFDPLRLTLMTGDDIGALHKTLTKYKTNGNTVQANVPGENLAKAIRSMLLNVKLKRNQFAVPNMTDPKTFLMNMPKGTKAGAMVQDKVEVFIMNGETRINRQGPFKTEAMVLAMDELNVFVHSLKEEFKEYLGGGKLSGKQLQEFAWKHLFIYKVNTKVEAIYGLEIDGDKLRTFFPAHIVKFMIDTIIWKPLVTYAYQKGSVMLGHAWIDGGAQKIYDRMKKFSKFFAWDVKGLDSAMKARIIQLIFETLYHCYDIKNTDEELSRMFTLFYHISVGHYVSKIVAWIDDFRNIVGAMASGELMTSIFNTFYCITVVLGWLHYIADHCIAKDERAAWIDKNITKIVLYVFGDDGLMGTDEEILNLFESITKIGALSLDDYMKKFWRLQIKASESIQTTTFLSTLDDAGDLKPGGVTILKRGFVEVKHNGKTYIGPCKSMSVTLGKLIKDEVPFRRVEDKAYCNYLLMCRAVGHAVDTCGVNEVMYNVCKYIYDLSFSEFVRHWNTGGVIDADALRQAAELLNGRFTQMAGVGTINIGEFSAIKFPTFEALREMFLPPRMVVREVEADWVVSRQRSAVGDDAATIWDIFQDCGFAI